MAKKNARVEIEEHNRHTLNESPQNKKDAFTDASSKNVLAFDVYFDESGGFTKANENWLIGGYLRPRQERNPDKQAKAWWREVLSEVKAKYSDTELEKYILAHCSENHIITSPRKDLQPMVLRILANKIKEVNGIPVIFFSPKGICGDNAEMNYIAVLSQGYAQLLAKLQQLYPNSSIRVYPHPSRREEDIHNRWLNWHEEDEDVRRQYISIMLVSAYGLCRHEDLKEALDGLQIITNKTKPCITKHGELVEDRNIFSTSGTHNLHNTIADYICNSYFSDIADCRTDILKDAIVCHVMRDGKKASWESKEEITSDEQVEEPNADVIHVESIMTVKTDPVDNVETEPGLDAVLLTTKDTFLQEDNLNRFNASQIYEQRRTIQLLCDEIKPRVERQEEMETVYSEMEAILEAAEHIKIPTIRAELKANLLLFKIAILNHRGEISQIEDASIKFIDAVNRMSDDFSRNALVAKFFNRQIVVSTDLFDFESSEKYFLEMQKYWGNHLETFNNRFGMIGDAFKPKLSSVVCPEFGKTIGSILQTARHQLRWSEGSTKFGIYLEALNRAHMAEIHLETSGDIARLEQTLADLESEEEFYQPAFLHLLKAAQLIGGENWEIKHALVLNDLEDNDIVNFDRCTAILEIAGEHGSDNPYLLSHYMRLASEMCFSGNTKEMRHPQIMLDALKIQENSLAPETYNVIRSTHPRTQILWKLGSVAIRCGLEEQGNKLMSAAYEQLVQTGASIFQAIAIAIRAEQAALEPAACTGYIEDIKNLYATFLVGKPRNMRDPYDGYGIKELESTEENLAEIFSNISRRIAY